MSRFMGTNSDELSLYTYTIIITHEANEERFYIEKKQGLKNKEEITKDEFEELHTFLSGRLSDQYEVNDFLKEFRTNRRAVHILHEYLIAKESVHDKYLKRKYKKILEDTYRGTITYFQTKGLIENAIYSDNNLIENYSITLEIAKEIIEAFQGTDQDLIIRFEGSLRKKPAEAIEVSEAVIEILKEEEKRIQGEIFGSNETNEYLNLDQIEEGNKMQEDKNEGPSTPDETSDDSQKEDDEKEV